MSAPSSPAHAGADARYPMPPRRQGRDIHEAHRVSTPLELLFDLTFVVAISQAASQLHHAIMGGHALAALPGYLLAFFSIWWAWMNYSWFASAYDDQTIGYRLLTMLQMVGVLLFATGVSGLFRGQFTAGVIGYSVMRLPQLVQWLRAAQADPARAPTCRRYALGIALAQAGWIALVLVTQPGWLAEGPWRWLVIVALAAFDMSIPLWAERAGQTPWHAHHIAERYGLLTIIVLGEVVLGATNSVAGMWQAHGWTPDLAVVALGSTLLVFGLWWMYFLMPSGESLHHHRERAFGWGYGHFVLFAAGAAVGSGLEAVADVLKARQDALSPSHPSHAEDAGTHAAAAPLAHDGIDALGAILSVAAAEALFVLALWALHAWATRSRRHHGRVTLLALVAIVSSPLAVKAGLSLPWALLLLSAGPVIAIAWHEFGVRAAAEERG